MAIVTANQPQVAAVVVAPVVGLPVAALPETGAAPVVADVVEAAPVVGQVEAAVTAPAETAPADAGTVPVGREQTRVEKLAFKIDAKRAQYKKLGEEIDRLEAQLRSVDLLDSVKEASIIKARVGRADTAREVVATVVGVQVLEGGDRRLKIYFGEGFDAETVVIQDSQITDVVQA